MKITIAIVLYQNDSLILQNLINQLLVNAFVSVIYLIDNSPNNSLKVLATSPKIMYMHNPSNPGFGAAHNIAIQKAIESGSEYHFIVNPDIIIQEDVINPMIKYISENPDIGMMMPQILNEDGSIQNLPKLLPSPFSILMRKLKFPKFLYNSFIYKYELRFVKKDIIYNAPILSGCFTLLNLEAIKKTGMYDERFFMYFEDWDLSRRMHQKYKTIYYPLVSVIHGYESGANKNAKLFKIFIHSAISYFKKWGWFFDSKRQLMNQKALEQFTT